MVREAPRPNFHLGAPVFSAVFQMFAKQSLKLTTLAHPRTPPPPSRRLTLTGTGSKSLKLRFRPIPKRHLLLRYSHHHQLLFLAGVFQLYNFPRRHEWLIFKDDVCSVDILHERKQKINQVEILFHEIFVPTHPGSSLGTDML